ncbi:MAG: tyrosine-type recombinase/integrase, partial [Chloroflexi bacterium]|nr:tyrosine-type recombinase/integrase [Chloroflexota bacterium]
LMLDDITPDGLVIRDTKFGKTRMVALHPTSWKALNLYLEVRLRETTPDRHLFVIATGRSPCRQQAGRVFRKLAEQVGLREPGAGRGPSLHSLRHSCATYPLNSLFLLDFVFLYKFRNRLVTGVDHTPVVACRIWPAESACERSGRRPASGWRKRPSRRVQVGEVQERPFLSTQLLSRSPRP